MAGHHASKAPRGHWRLPAACSAVTTASLIVTCTCAGLFRLIAGLALLASLAGALWLAQQARPRAIAASVGLTLAFLVLAGLALAAVHALTTVPTALTIATASLAATWATPRLAATPHTATAHPSTAHTATTHPSTAHPSTAHPARKPRLAVPGLLALAGAAVFAAAAVLAVHHAAASAAADNDEASSLAVWAYSSGGQLHVGAQEPAGHGVASLRIVVTQAGITTAAWNDIRLVPGQPWQAPALTLTRNGPVRVTALQGATVLATTNP
jgi:hypothetical protein